MELGFLHIHLLRIHSNFHLNWEEPLTVTSRTYDYILTWILLDLMRLYELFIFLFLIFKLLGLNIEQFITHVHFLEFLSHFLNLKMLSYAIVQSNLFLRSFSYIASRGKGYSQLLWPGWLNSVRDKLSFPELLQLLKPAFS